MANTSSIAALQPEIWQKELYRDVMDGLFFVQRNMMGTETNNVIQVKDELSKNQGDRVTFGLSAKLSGAGISGDAELEGNEESISSFAESVLIDQKRFGVRLTGKLDEQTAAYDMRMDAKEKLAIRMMEFEERQIMMKLAGVTSTDLQDTNGVTYSADATWSNSAPIVPAADEAAGTGARYICTESTGLDALAAADVLTTTFITRAKTKAVLANPKVVPLRIGGENHYVMFIHPFQEADLKTNASDVWAQAQREAQSRAKDNPIFSGALGMWDGVILHSHEYVSVAQSGADFSPGATAAGAQAFRATLCGQQAIAFAQSKNPNGFVEETFDYKNKVGYATGLIGGIQKPAFNSLDYGVITVDSGATDIS